MRKQLVAQAVALSCALLLLAGWNSTAALAKATGNVRAPAHLYVSVYTARKNNAILRYALKDGLPAAAPDLVINDFGVLAAVALDGQVYTGEGRGTFFAFRPGATKPYRRFHIQPPQYQFVVATAADLQGNFWVETWEPSEVNAQRRSVLNQAMAFPPDARGDVKPIRRLKGGSFGLAFNNRNHMLVDGFYVGPAVVAIADPIEHPHLVRAYRDSNLNDPQAMIAVNSADELFVQSRLANGAAGIAVFAPDADPLGPPTNLIETTFTHLFGLAAAPRYVYAIDDDANVLDVYLTGANGPQEPLYSYAIASGRGVGLIAGP